MTPNAITLDLAKELQKLEIKPLIALYTLDVTELGGGILRFYSGVDKDSTPVLFAGNAYLPFPVEATGFEWRSQGELPRPHVRFANVSGLFTALVLNFDDLSGARFTRERVFTKYLDGQPDANPRGKLSNDVFFVDRKVTENKNIVEFELVSSLELDGVMFPRRQVYANLCGSLYRGPECGYAEDKVITDAFGNDLGLSGQSYKGLWDKDSSYTVGDVVYIERQGIRILFIMHVAGSVLTGAETAPPNKSYWTQDACTKRISSGCKKHFDPLNQGTPLPYGAFPGTNRVPVT